MNYCQEMSFIGETYMKIFISWSGQTSKKIAEILKKWLPCIIQSIEVFYSSEDIEKGDKWEYKISNELSDSKFGIICLTPENISAPWINFEAGAIAKSLDSHVATLMININPSDIQGPLARYQATKIERDDFYQLIKNINSTSDKNIDEEVLKNTFDSIWEKMSKEIYQIISSSSSTKSKSIKTKKDNIDNNAIEEILQLLRKQNSLLTSPENLLPVEYFLYMNNQIHNNVNNDYDLYDELYDLLLNFFNLIKQTKQFELVKINNIIHIIDNILNRLPDTNNIIWLNYVRLRKRFINMSSYNYEEFLDRDNSKE